MGSAGPHQLFCSHDMQYFRKFPMSRLFDYISFVAFYTLPGSIKAADDQHLCRGFLILGCVESGVLKEIGEGVHDSLGLLRFFPLHTGTLTRLVLNEGFSSAL
jgi:hypothetical protein